MKFKILSSKRKVKTALGVPVLNFLWTLNLQLWIPLQQPTRLTFRTDGIGCGRLRCGLDLLWSVPKVRPRQWSLKFNV
jgi:hypothetical protein